MTESSDIAPRRERQSWVNTWIDWLEGLPGPQWVVCLIGIALSILVVASTDWLSGVSVGQIRLERVVWGSTLVGTLWLIHHLDLIARAAFREFRPLLDITDGRASALEYELTTMPARPALVLLALSGLRTVEAFIFQPESEGIVGYPPMALAIRWPFETVTIALMFVLVYHTIRQLRLVSRLHAEATRINLFQAIPLYALSRLTSHTAIGLALLVIPFGGATYFAAESAFEYATAFGLALALLAAALLSFGAPLLGMHSRMDVEKMRLLTEAGRRIESLIGDLHRSVDRRELGAADGQNKALTSLLAERELIGQLSVWPWQAGTAGAVVSAVVLPIGAGILPRLIERFL